MSNNTSKISVNYNEIANLAKQLNNKDKIKLSNELKNSLKGGNKHQRLNEKEYKVFLKNLKKLRGSGSGNLNETLLRDRARDKARESKEFAKSFLELRGTGSGNLNKSLLQDRLRDKRNEQVY